MSGCTDLAAMEADLRRLRDAMRLAESEAAPLIGAVHPTHRRSAANLVHYVELRKHDIRGLQAGLSAAGLSSLGHCEGDVLASIEVVMSAASRLCGGDPDPASADIALDEGAEILERNADRLLGPAPTGRSTRIMVTLPTEAAQDASLVRGLVDQGMDLARVNCAHDDVEAWSWMVGHVRSCSNADGQRCLVAMDLGGPKLRTGPLVPGPRVVRIKPRRDASGVVVEPGRAWLCATGEVGPSEDPGDPVIEVPIVDAGWVARRRRGDLLTLTDARGKRRQWEVVEAVPRGVLISTVQTTYVAAGQQITCRSSSGRDDVTVGELPRTDSKLRVHRGDRIVLTRSLVPSRSSSVTEHRIGCSMEAVFRQARPGERVWLDDGNIGGTIDRVSDDELVLTVTDARPGGVNLKAGKGINLPDTDLHLRALTAEDRVDLEFVAGHADIVNFSFVRHPDDVADLVIELDRLDATDIGIVLKIENEVAFHNLPELLLTAMRRERVGVMIARGDLAVEVGFDRLAEVQEEIMWACEAAHVPVIWATQVLDTLARTGRPSRSEISDAALSDRAECVMLNKGPYIVDAIRSLDSILTRMQGHRHKQRATLRRLRAWGEHD